MHPYDDLHVVERLTTWWARWGRILIGVLTVVLITVAGFSIWKYWQKRQTARAALVYEQLHITLSSEPTSSSGETKKARIAHIATDLEKRFGHTPYAQMGALVAAKALYQASDMQAAKARLQWAADSAIDVEYRHIARLRLAALLLEEKAYDAALQILNLKSPTPAFAALYAQQRGDVLAAQGQHEQARVAYRDALHSVDEKNSAVRLWVQMKLDALGG